MRGRQTINENNLKTTSLNCFAKYLTSNDKSLKYLTIQWRGLFVGKETCYATLKRKNGHAIDGCGAITLVEQLVAHVELSKPTIGRPFEPFSDYSDIPHVREKICLAKDQKQQDARQCEPKTDSQTLLHTFRRDKIIFMCVLYMSEPASAPNLIDEKKAEQSSSSSSSSSKDLKANIVQFLTYVAVLFLAVLMYFAGSGLVLFVCKIAQANVLPTDAKCHPYTDARSSVPMVPTNIFETLFADPAMSMKLYVPQEEFNTTYPLLSLLRDYKQKPSSHFLANYLIAVLEQALAFNYSAINAVMNGLNTALPEIAVVALGPVLTAFLFACVSVLSVIQFIYAWFANLGWFFKQNANDTGEGSPVWKDVGLSSPMEWGAGLALMALFVVLLFVGFGMVPFVSFAILSYCVLSCLSYKVVLNTQMATAFTVVKETMKHYKLPMVGLLTFFVVALAFSNLGILAGVVAVAVLGLIYWGVVSIDLFKPIGEHHLSPLVSYKQAVRKCVGVKKKEQHGFLYNWLVGGDVTKDLKKLGKAPVDRSFAIPSIATPSL